VTSFKESNITCTLMLIFKLRSLLMQIPLLGLSAAENFPSV